MSYKFFLSTECVLIRRLCYRNNDEEEVSRMKKLGKKIVNHENTLTAFCATCTCDFVTCTCKSTSYDPTGTYFSGSATIQQKGPNLPYTL